MKRAIVTSVILGEMKRAVVISVILVLVVMVVALTAAVVRLENYHYANFLGRCAEFDIAKPQQRIERERCLKAEQTRTHWFWHVVYGVGLL